MKKKILVQTAHLAPYRDYIFEELRNRGYDVYYLIHEQIINHSEWNYKSKIDRNKIYYGNKIKCDRFGFLVGGIDSIVEDINPDVYICDSLKSIMHMKKKNKEVTTILSADTIQDNSSNNPIKKMVLSYIYNKADSFFVPGKASKNYFISRGVKEDKIFMGSYTDNAEIIVNKIGKINRKYIRSLIGINENDFVILFVGKLISTRNIPLLTEICNSFSSITNIKMIIIGSGDNDKTIEEYNNSNLIHINSVSREELESYYAISDLYIHPGCEPYSLALYEAAICSKPIISNSNVGAVYDCIHDEFNGFIIRSVDKEDYIDKISRIYNNYDHYQKNAYKMSEYILKERGIKWACSQLEQAINIKKEL